MVSFKIRFKGENFLHCLHREFARAEKRAHNDDTGMPGLETFEPVRPILNRGIFFVDLFQDFQQQVFPYGKKWKSYLLPKTFALRHISIGSGQGRRIIFKLVGFFNEHAVAGIERFPHQNFP